jgi:hypothetical protein
LRRITWPFLWKVLDYKIIICYLPPCWRAKMPITLPLAYLKYWIFWIIVTIVLYQKFRLSKHVTFVHFTDHSAWECIKTFQNIIKRIDLVPIWVYSPFDSSQNVSHIYKQLLCWKSRSACSIVFCIWILVKFKSDILNSGWFGI